MGLWGIAPGRLGRYGVAGAMPLFAEAEDRFFAKVADARVAFVRGDDGRVTHLVLRLSGREYKAAKGK